MASDFLRALGLSIKLASCQGMLVSSLPEHEFLDLLGTPVSWVSLLCFLGVAVTWVGHIVPWRDRAALLTQLVLTSLHRAGLVSFPLTLAVAI